MSIISPGTSHRAGDAARWRRVRGAAIAASGLVLVVAAVTLVLLDEEERGDAGGDMVERLLVEPSPWLESPVDTLAPAPAVPLRSGHPPVGGRVAVPPERLVIPSIDVGARVTPVGVSPAGAMELPSVREVGWYRFGPGLDARAGAIVLAGHVDSASAGRGALFRLRDLEPRDRIVLQGGDGGERAFRVVGRRVWSKASIPLDRLFARGGAPRLVVITCGGDYDWALQQYEDNVVIVAVPDADSD